MFPSTQDTAKTRTAFGSPHDVFGRGMVLCDWYGMPIRPGVGSAVTFDGVYDSPYEFNLSRKAARNTAVTGTPPAVDVTMNPNNTLNPVDRPFTPAELERILRMYDIDANDLPSRLKNLMTGTPALPLVRGLVTSDSYDLPTPPVLPMYELRDLAQANSLSPVSLHITDLLRMRLLQGTMPATNIPAQISKMLPPELVAGCRMDLNRPFGNGRDDDGNHVVDEPLEDETTNGQWTSTMNVPSGYYSTAIQGNLTNGMDLNADGAIDATDKQMVRQLYARYLYVLMMLLRNNVEIDFNGDSNTSTEETARGIAQWAVNVADFRDSDSIMTAFEYDAKPFDIDGWSVDGDLSTTSESNRGVVWGCERPELLITETLAFHDVRTEDLAMDTARPRQRNDEPRRRTTTSTSGFSPRAALFVELYNPWMTEGAVVESAGRPASDEAPGEFYTMSGGIAVGVYLNRKVPGTNDPIWRMIISENPLDSNGKYCSTPMIPWLAIGPRSAAASTSPTRAV